VLVTNIVPLASGITQTAAQTARIVIIVSRIFIVGSLFFSEICLPKLPKTLRQWGQESGFSGRLAFEARRIITAPSRRQQNFAVSGLARGAILMIAVLDGFLLVRCGGLLIF
jgi:hypothetical protein